jgi:predicted AlkP superfamily pyrophosphatase or phosphodiesterase
MRRLPLASLLFFIASCAITYPDLLPPRPPSPPAGPARAEHVVIISIDGLRPDAIGAAPAPNLQALIRRGAYCATAQTIRPSVTLPSHTSMLTGLDFNRHGVTWNHYRPGHIGHATVFAVTASAGKTCAMLYAKDKFHYLADPAAVTWVYGSSPPKTPPKPEDYTTEETLKSEEEWEARPFDPKKEKPPETRTSAEAIARSFSATWTARRFALTFVHLREPDESGHRYGWMGEKYLEAVRAADRAVGEIVEAIEKSGATGKTAILATADHGGSGRGHFRRSDLHRPENVTIPWICAGPKVPAGLVIDRMIPTFDTAPTALAFLGLSFTGEIDGRAVEEVLPR